MQQTQLIVRFCYPLSTSATIVRVVTTPKLSAKVKQSHQRRRYKHSFKVETIASFDLKSDVDRMTTRTNKHVSY